MSDLNNYSVDDEMGKYIDAFEIKQANINMRSFPQSRRRFNPNTNRNDVLAQMENGGYIKVGDEEVVSKQPSESLVANLQTDAPEQPMMQENTDQSMDTPGASIESAMEYADTVKTKAGQVTADDMLAAGYDESTIKAIGIGADVEPMVLSTQEIEDRLRNGGSFIGEYDPTIRENGRVELTQYLMELAEDSLAEDLRAQGIRALNPEADTDATLTEDQIATLIEGERPRLENEARSLSGMFFGDETTFGIGVGDFVTAGVMDIQEGARLFKQGVNNDSVANRSLGALLVLAGIAEATGVGMVVGKAIKKSIPTLRAGLANVGERLNQPGQMPTVGSNLGNVGDVAKVEAPTANKPGIIAFHGSGTDFNEFKLEKIGTGEGNQAYGYGLYFTDVEDIANFYKANVGFGNEVTYKGKIVADLDSDSASYEENIAHMIGQQNNLSDQKRVFNNEFSSMMSSLKGIEQAIKDFNTNPTIYPLKFKGLSLTIDDALRIKNDFAERVSALNEIEKNFDKIKTKPKGKTYQVNLDVNINDLVDYDKSLNEQSSKIKKALQPFYAKYGVANSADFGTLLESVKSSRSIPEDEFSEQLAAQGIQGVKYKAAGSRGADRDVADVKMNYVIFDDRLIDILKKYGIAAPVAVSSMAVKSTDQENET